MKDRIEYIRAVTRPIILILFVISSASYIGYNIDSPLADLWVKFTMIATGEWLFERIVKKIPINWGKNNGQTNS